VTANDTTPVTFTVQCADNPIVFYRSCGVVGVPCGLFTVNRDGSGEMAIYALSSGDPSVVIRVGPVTGSRVVFTRPIGG
jgi:hypothetical protein